MSQRIDYADLASVDYRRSISVGSLVALDWIASEGIVALANRMARKSV